MPMDQHPCSASDELSIQLPQPHSVAFGLHPGPWAEAGCHVSKWVSSSCLSAVVSKADRNILCDLPSLACLKTMTLLSFMGEVSMEV